MRGTDEISGLNSLAFVPIFPPHVPFSPWFFSGLRLTRQHGLQRLGSVNSSEDLQLDRVNRKGRGMENETIRDGFASDPESKTLRVQAVLRQVHQELRQLLQQRADVVQRICTIKKTIVGLASLLEDDDVLNSDLRELVHGGGTRKPGLTQACRLILMKAGRAIGARDVRDQIQETAPTILIGHKDSMASVTTILTRLVTYGEAHVSVAANGKRVWQWAGHASAEENGDDDSSGSSHSSVPAKPS